MCVYEVIMYVYTLAEKRTHETTLTEEPIFVHSFIHFNMHLKTNALESSYHSVVVGDWFQNEQHLNEQTSLDYG